MSETFTPEEWERRMASLREDARIVQAEINENQRNVDWLRGLGHDFPAEVLQQGVDKAQATLDESLALANEAQGVEDDD